MTGHRILQECRDALIEAIEKDHAENGAESKNAVAKVDTRDGWIELYVDRYGTQASVCHDREENDEHELTTFESAICAAAPDWWDAEEDDDYPKVFDGVDEGFGSFEDYLNYMYGN